MKEFIPIEIGYKKFAYVGEFTDARAAFTFAAVLAANGVPFVGDEATEERYPRRYPIERRDVAERNGMTTPIAPTIEAVLEALKGSE